MAKVVQGISSMATGQLLIELASAYESAYERRFRFESIGGTTAAARVQADEAFDLVVLASNAIDSLAEAGKVVPETKTDLVESGVALAVRDGEAHPEISTAAALKDAVLSAASIGYSTGPSGVALLKLFDQWGLTDSAPERLVQAPPGVPVGQLVANGEVAIGFQQLSELIHVPGIDIVGPMPSALQIKTIFSAAVCSASTAEEDARRVLNFLAAPETAEAKHAQGMTPI